ncbi:hypothetical protein C8R43DRAFT_1131528 [Mycena crocata]|nr:hypothetical protein C8R43DRAFT_1131528 [Mycena crocata]
MVSPGLPVQELWEHVIDSVHSIAELNSCSLVCHAFVARAQSHIFRSIFINGPLSSILAQHELSNRLTGLMASSPHLVRYVEAITIVAFDEEVLAAIAGITWPHLKHIGLDRMVMLKHCWMTSGPPNPPHERPPIAICRLSFYGSSDMVELLSEPQFPLDFTALTEIEILGPWDPRLPTFFRQTHSTVRKLRFSGVGTLEGIQDVDFGMFPSLAHITVHGLGPLFETVLNRLPTDNRITDVHLVLYD